MKLRDVKSVGVTRVGPDDTIEARRPSRAAAQRTALPEAWPRPVKIARGRTFEMPPPAHIRVIGAAVDPADRDAIARKLGMKLGKFAASIERVSVRLADANGPKGGVDQVCRIKVVLSGLPSVLVGRRAGTGLGEHIGDKAQQRRVRERPLQHGDRADRVGGVEEIEAKPSLAIDQEDDRNGAIEQMQRRFGHRPRVRGGQHEVNPAGPAGAVYAFGQDVARIGQQAAEVVAQPVIRRQHQDVGLGHV